ncbi:hypothetical protein ACC687_41050, partial [Rhizobium ruizarguesonis]
IAGLVNTTLSDKLQSQSGEERTACNTLALISFVDTATFGAGLGTVRASIFIAALLSYAGRRLSRGCTGRRRREECRSIRH